MDRARKTTTDAATAALAELRAAARSADSNGSAGFARRDPRVTSPSESTKKTVTIAESCRFYGVQDAVSTCRAPRSCQDCLKMPDCVITDGGVCQSVHDVVAEPVTIILINTTNRFSFRSATWGPFPNNDYQNFLQPLPNGTAYNITLAAVGGDAYFYSANTAYCAASDPVCTQCRAHFKAVASSADTISQNRSQFCVGDGGCVCVAVCEVPELLAVRAKDTECHAHLELPVRRYDRFTRPNRWNQRRDPRTSLDSATVKPQREPSCGFDGLVDTQSNQQPRTCGDCLTREGCMLSLAASPTGDGLCRDTESYAPTLDFRAQKPESNSPLHFPSNSTSYCPASDPVCTTCRKKFLAKGPNASMTWNDWKTRNESTHCIGQGGCVCIEQCEVNAVDQRHLDCDPAKAGQSVTESCGYYDVRDAKGCRQPRTCSDCLQKEDCMIYLADRYICTSMSVTLPPNPNPILFDQTLDSSLERGYSSERDFRTEAKFEVRITDALQFPANSTTICSASDSVCAFCRKEFFQHQVVPNAYGSLWVPASDTVYCVGQDGCVCIDWCERPEVFKKYAQGTRRKLGDVRNSDDVVTGVFLVLLLALGVLVMVGLSWRRRVGVSEDPVSARLPPPLGMLRHMLNEAPALTLDLDGWRRFQRVLRAKERELLAGAGDVSPVAHPVGFDYDAVPTAPDFDTEDDPTAPTPNDPHALASAPPVIFRASSQLDPAPSAPDFDW